MIKQFKKLEDIVGGFAVWNWKKEIVVTNDYMKSAKITKEAYKKILNDFRPDTPERVINTFKEMCIDRRGSNFKYVNIDFNM